MTRTLHATSGEAVESVLKEYEVFASYEPMSTRGDLESVEAYRQVAFGTAKFQVPYIAGIDATWKIKDWQERVWDIVGVPVDVERQRIMQIVAELRQ